jgi:hypothetical protein
MLLTEIKNLGQNVAEHICEQINAAIKEQAANIAEAEYVLPVGFLETQIILVKYLHKSELSKTITGHIVKEVLEQELPKDNLLGLKYMITHAPTRITVRIMVA